MGFVMCAAAAGASVGKRPHGRPSWPRGTVTPDANERERRGRIHQGTGSKPPGWYGWQRPMRRTVSHVPRSGRVREERYFRGAFLNALDVNKDGEITKAEMTESFSKWFQEWNTTKSGEVSDEQLRAGINKDLSPFRGGPPPGFAPPQ